MISVWLIDTQSMMKFYKHTILFSKFQMKTIRTKQFVDKIKGHKYPVISLYSPMGPSGHLLYSASSDGLIFVWDTSSKQIVHKTQLTLPDKPQQQNLNLSCVEFSENIVYGSLSSGQIYSWNIKQNAIVGQFLFHTSPVIHLQKINPRVLMSAGAQLVMWDTVSGTLETRYMFDGPVNSVCVSGVLVYLISNRHQLVIADSEKQQLVCCQDLQKNKYYVKVAVTSKYLLLFSHDFEVEIVELPYETGKKPKARVLLAYTSVSAVREFQDQIILACHDQTLRYLSKQLTEIDKYEGHEGSLNCMQLCCSMLYTGSSDHSIRSWDLLQIQSQQRERRQMQRQELLSVRYEVYLKVKNKKRKVKRRKA